MADTMSREPSPQDVDAPKYVGPEALEQELVDAAVAFGALMNGPVGSINAAEITERQKRLDRARAALRSRGHEAQSAGRKVEGGSGGSLVQ